VFVCVCMCVLHVRDILVREPTSVCVCVFVCYMPVTCLARL